MRKLNTGDLIKVGRMLKKAMPALQSADFNKLDTETPDQHKNRVGQAVLFTLIEHCFDDVWIFLADVFGMSYQELEAKSIDETLDLIKQLGESEDLRGFFGKVSALM